MYGPKTVPFQPEVVEVVGKEHRRLGAERKLLFTFCLLPAPITCRSARRNVSRLAQVLATLGRRTTDPVLAKARLSF